MKIRRILITRTDRLGDVVLSTPIIRFMRERYPDAYIAFMVRPENCDVVANDPYLDEIIVYDKRGPQKSFSGTLKFVFSLRKKGFDTAIALHPENRAHIILFLAGIPVRIGYDRKLGWLLTESFRHRKQEGDKHEADYNFDLLEQAGFDTEGADRKPYIFTGDKEKSAIDAVFAGKGLGRDVIAIHAGASCPSKRWPPEKFAAAADILALKYSADIVLVGGKETVEFSRRVVSAMKNKACDLTGTLRVAELAEFLSRCRLFISNDSGPVHVAAAVKTPVIAIFGRRDPGLSPKRWGPLGPSDTVVHGNDGCAICLAHNCEKDFACINAVTPDAVIAAAEKILGPPPATLHK
ncbi:MAG: lipopolysaccharide heptosyltransferase II [Candidatus Omnitrophota bacterium]